MNSSNAVLADFIRETIQREGPVSFRWFMEQALYHPAHGFYSSGRCAIGRGGDYFTNVSVGSLFGHLLAAQFAEMWELLGRPSNFTIAEQGAHNGDFARDMLQAAREQAPDFFRRLRYIIIEPIPIWQDSQAAALTSYREKIEWRKSLEEIDPFSGVHFSNELLDAMPVHLIAANNSRWEEKYVMVGSEGFEFARGPISTERLRNHLRKIPAPPTANYETEVNLAALDWIEILSRKLERGYILTVDYGYPREEYYSSERTSGTLRCYAQHRVAPSPFINLGQTDITAHLDWTSLVEQAEECGLRLAGFTDQHHFITALITTFMAEQFFDAVAQRRALQTLSHPGLLGRTFQFLALAKGMAAKAQLSGFKFARDARATLGMNSR